MAMSGLAKGVGLLSGPSIGSLIFALTNYTLTFVTFGIFIVGMAFLMFFFLPSSLNKRVEVKNENDEQGQLIEIKYTNFFMARRCCFAVVTLSCVFLATCFYDSCLAVMLNEFYGVDEKGVGFVFLLPLVAYMMAPPLISVLRKRLHRRFIILIGMIVSTIAVFMTGPSELLGFPL